MCFSYLSPARPVKGLGAPPTGGFVSGPGVDGVVEETVVDSPGVGAGGGRVAVVVTAAAAAAAGGINGPIIPPKPSL